MWWCCSSGHVAARGCEGPPSQAADWLAVSIGDWLIPGEDLKGASASCGPDSQSTWPPSWLFKMLPDSSRGRGLWEAMGPARRS